MTPSNASRLRWLLPRWPNVCGLMLAACSVACTWALPPERLTRAAEPEVQPLFDSGQNGYGRYRIPALLVTPRGTVLAFCEGRRKASGLTGDIDLVLRRSTDGGRTWTALQVVADDGPNTLGNPCPVFDPQTDTLWLPFTRSPGQFTEAQIVGGQASETTTVWVTKSKDEGVTWSQPVEITAAVKKPDWTWYGTGPGIGLALPSGRLLIPAYHAIAGSGVYRTHAIWSDDHGQTWQSGAIVQDHTTEAQLALRRDGTIALNTRNISTREQGPVRPRITALSRDQGQTWTNLQRDDELTEPSCQGSLLVYSGLKADEPSRWLFSNPPGPGRSKLTVRLSNDEGQTWPVARMLEPGTSEYSSLARLPDGQIGCLYERSPGKTYSVQIVLARFPLSWLEAASVKNQADQ